MRPLWRVENLQCKCKTRCTQSRLQPKKNRKHEAWPLGRIDKPVVVHSSIVSACRPAQWAAQTPLHTQNIGTLASRLVILKQQSLLSTMWPRPTQTLQFNSNGTACACISRSCQSSVPLTHPPMHNPLISHHTEVGPVSSKEKCLERRLTVTLAFVHWNAAF